MTATTTDLRERARAAFARDADESAANLRRKSIEGGKMLAECLRERLGLALDVAPDRPSVAIEGIRFEAYYDSDCGYRDAWRSWVLRAAIVLPSDEYGPRTSDWVRIESLVDLGGLIEEYEEPGAF